MPLSPPRRSHAAWLLGGLLALGACVPAERMSAPSTPGAIGTPRLGLNGTSNSVVISQVYGGGGNAGAIFRSDFIELYNPGTTAVSLVGWSVQYASSTGTSWTVTNLSGSIQANQYYLVKQADGANVTTSTPLPTPDLTPPTLVAMSGTSAKVALVNMTTALSGSCPVSTSIVDFVGYGTAANCSESSPTATLSNTTAAIRKLGGLTDADNNSTDFSIAAAAPRNSNSPANPAVPTVAGPVTSVAIAPAFASVAVGATTPLVPSAKDANGVVASTTFMWTSSNDAIATVSSSGVVTGITDGGPVTITATSANNVAGTAQITVTPAPGTVTTVTVAPSTVSVGTGATTPLTAAAFDVSSNSVSTTFTWMSSNTAIATVSSSGVVTGVTVGGPVSITATSANNVVGSSQVTVTSPALTSIMLNSSSNSFPPGFQTQLFPSARAGSTTVASTFTFVSLDPTIATVATVQNTGIITGVSGSATRPRIQVTATPVGGGASIVSTLTPVTIETPVSSAAGTYGTNNEFGDPTPAGTSVTDFLITRPQYTISYNQTRGTPNWVSYELDKRHMVSGADRCNCFSADPLLPVSAQLLTSDYTNGGFDRGHMARSFDRTVSNVDNANTFYLTNIVPQQADLNQGVWAQFENALGDSATLGGRAVYIITGPLYATGATPRWIKQSLGEQKIQIPDSTWKVAIIGPYSAGNPFTRGSIVSWDDLANTTVLAVNMPNVSGVRNDPWSKYLTSVDQIETSTGYDFLSLLQTAYQTAVEAGDRAPVASFTGGTSTVNEGTTINFDASASTDPDLAVTGFNEALTYAWNFGDGTTSTLKTATKTYADNNSYSVTLTVTDRYGWPRTTSRSVTVANAVPVATLVARTPTTVSVGQTVTFGASGTDAGLKDAPWTFAYDFGDGTTYSGTVTALPAASRPLLRAKSWSTPGTYNVTLTIRDKDGAVGSSSVAVIVNP